MAKDDLKIQTHSVENPLDIQLLFESDFYQIKDWNFNELNLLEDQKGYNDCFCIAFIRSGLFSFDLNKTIFELHSGHLMFEKPNYEYSLKPKPGAWSIFNFSDTYYERLIDDCNLTGKFFFANKNLISLLLKSTSEVDYLHTQILNSACEGSKLNMDTMVMELVKCITQIITQSPINIKLSDSLKRNHLNTIECAKDYLQRNFSEDISLFQLASICNVSPFHFSRIFKKMTSYSPYQYLLGLRLKNAEYLIKTTTIPLTDICFSSGFNSLEHFATSFKRQFRYSPSQYRKGFHVFL